jgi:hypothetical protein
VKYKKRDEREEKKQRKRGRARTEDKVYELKGRQSVCPKRKSSEKSKLIVRWGHKANRSGDGWLGCRGTKKHLGGW